MLRKGDGRVRPMLELGGEMKRIVTLVASVALVAAGLNVPAGAQETPPPVVPETVIIDDGFGDANGLNDQGQGGVTGFQGDNDTPVDAGNASDLGKIWFTDDAATITAHIQTELPPPGSQGLRYDVFTATSADSALGCVRFVAFFEGKVQGQSTTWRGPTAAKFFDACNDGANWFNNGVEATLSVATLADGTAVISITAPKAASPLVATGATLTGTTAASRVLTGEASAVGAAYVPYIDNTKKGIDYVVTGGEVETEEPPPPKKCVKGKPKKACKKKG
jgi:hypothetical protein